MALVKKPHVKSRYAQKEAVELLRCQEDPVYFMENYIWVQHPMEGRVKFELYDYQHEMVDVLHNHKDVVILASRQLRKMFVKDK